MHQAISEKLKAFGNQIDEIPEGRKAVLRELAGFIAATSEQDSPAKATFICTHNSRRSHFCQVWAAAAAAHLDVPFKSFSGGTEVTAFHPNALKALEQLGFKSTKSTGGNPMYLVSFAENAEPLRCFSKKYDSPENPEKNFMAVMNCDEADEACPFIPGAKKRLSLPYTDPKVSDGTPNQEEVYRNTCLEIGREMFYAMDLAKNLLAETNSKK